MSSSATYQLISTLSSSGSSSVLIWLGSVNTINTQIAALSSHQSGQSSIPGTPQHSSPWDHKWTSCHHHICTRQGESEGLVPVVSPLLLPVAHGSPVYGATRLTKGVSSAQAHNCHRLRPLQLQLLTNQHLAPSMAQFYICV